MSFKPSITVSELLLEPFKLREEKDQLEIISRGKPRPILNMLKIIVKDRKGRVSQDCNLSIYDEISWLTACPFKNRLYCWPCLLFEKRGLWNYTGIIDVFDVKNKKNQHENSADHMNALLQLHMFNAKGKTCLPENYSKEKKIHLIDLCCAATEEQLLSGSKNILLDKQKCTEIMLLLHDYDAHNKSLSKDILQLITTDPYIINKVVSAISHAVKLAIANEIRHSNYVAIILSEHSNVRSKPLISTILRYIKNDKVCERFVGFTSLSKNLTADFVCQYITNVLKENQISEEKLRAVSLGGAVLPISYLLAFAEKMKETFPSCSLVPWYSHKVDHTLQDTLSSIPACGHFSKVMSSMQNYFQENGEFFQNSMRECNSPLISLYSDNVLSLECTCDKFASSQFIISVDTHRQSFIHFFDASNMHTWDAENLVKANGYRKYLEDVQFVFILKMFKEIFKITSNLANALQDDKYNFDKNMTYQLQVNLIKMHKESFYGLWHSVTDEIANHFHKLFLSYSKERKTDSFIVKTYHQEKNKYSSLFNSIMLLTMRDMNCRYGKLDKLKFCNLFNFENKGEMERLKSCTKSLIQSQRREINEELILNELSVLWDCDLFNKKITECCELLHEHYFRNTFKALADIMELILTLPIKPATRGNDVTKLQKIEKWSHSYNGSINLLGDMSVLGIEISFYKEVIQYPSFKEEIMNFF